MAVSAATLAMLPVPFQRRVTNKWLVTVSVTFGTLMGAIDSSIVNVALPHIRGSVGATVQEITWISTGFVIATVLVMPLTGFLGRLFGQKRVYMFCLALFVAGSMLCGLARTLPTLVLFRFIQGLGAGALQPTEQAILRQTFPPKEQGMAMALFGMAIMIGPAIGPTLGGWIVDHYPWPWIFYINLPVGVLGLYMVSQFVHEPDDIRAANIAAAQHQRRNMDWWGIGLLSIGISSLQYVLEEGANDDWFQSRLILGLTLASVFAIAAFVIRELTAVVPAVNLRLFKDRTFATGTLISGVMFAMLMSSMFLLPVFMQELLGFNATQSGLALMPRTLVMMLAVPIVGRVYNRVSPKVTVAIGVLFFVFGAWQQSHFTADTTSSGIIAAIVLQGVGFSCLFVPLTTVSLATVPRAKLADATGLSSLVRQIGGSIGLAVFATLIGNYATHARAGIAAHVVETRPEVAQRLMATQGALMARGLDAVTAGKAAIGSLYGRVVKQSMFMSFDKLFLLSGILFLVILPLLLFLKIPTEQEKDRAAEAVHIDI